jgi:hypothetical protein
MKMRNSPGKKPAAREMVRRASRADAINLPRLFLFLEVFVEKEVSERSAK